MIKTWLSRIRALFRGRQLDDDLDADVRAHLDLLTADYVRAGMAQTQARLAARRAFGGVEQMKEAYRDRRTLRWGEDMWRDLRYALRMLRRDRGLASIAVITLALGIGANTALFSVIDALMLRPLPVSRPEELRLLTIVNRGHTNAPGFSFSYPLYEDLRARADAFSGFIAVGGLNAMRLVVAGDEQSAGSPTEIVRTQGVSGTFFPVLGVAPVAGRVLDPADNDPKAAVAAVVLSDGFWARRFGRDPRVVGRRITINEVPFTIVGVVSAGFRGVQVGVDPDLWWPNHFLPRLANAPPNLLTERGYQSWLVIGRLAPGADDARAQAQVAAIYQADLVQRLERRTRLGERTTPSEQRAFLEQAVRLESGTAGWTSLRWEFERPLFVLMIVVLLVLLIACANVANLLLARAAVRRREIAVRMAIGSGRGRLIRQLVTESLLLAGIGGILGLGVAFLGATLVPAFMAGQEIDLRVGPDARVLSFTALVSLASALVFGLMPALSATRLDFSATLNEQTRAATGRLHFHNAIVVAQVALSVVVLIAAGLFVRTLTNLQGLETGFDREHLTVFALQMPSRYDTERRMSVYREVIDSLQRSPDTKASYSFFGLFSGSEWTQQTAISGYSPRPDEQMDAVGMIVGPGFFEAVGTRLLVGRSFESADDASPVRAAIVNQTLARRFFGQQPLGRRFSLPLSFPKDTFEVVGVAEDSTYRQLRQEAQGAQPMFYLPSSQAPGMLMASRMRNAQVEVRTATGGAGLEPMIRRAVRSVDQAIAVTELRSMTAMIDRTIAQERLLARLAAWLGVLALALGAIGIYGVRSYTVTRRTSEIGLRLALGATTAQIFGLVVNQGVKVTALGVVIGVAVAAAMTRYVETLLFRVAPLDPTTFAAVGALFLSVAVMASYGPARRAARVDPAVTLRSE